ncbi:hypothetical protein EVAR_29323_1 [Eumeta japonica]|uniref:Uncharacterized protein n=1 Tax=Eumeta variegata TaxID=151549 RepID=A0A4C1WKB7_EUMVA|nr:hypothetical protein EVAR_29323_1 [Eumeta japonica]
MDEPGWLKRNRKIRLALTDVTIRRYWIPIERISVPLQMFMQDKTKLSGAVAHDLVAGVKIKCPDRPVAELDWSVGAEAATGVTPPARSRAAAASASEVVT